MMHPMSSSFTSTKPDTTSAINSRVQGMAARIGLDQSDLRRFSAIGIDTIA